MIKIEIDIYILLKLDFLYGVPVIIIIIVHGGRGHHAPRVCSTADAYDVFKFLNSQIWKFSKFRNFYTLKTQVNLNGSTKFTKMRSDKIY